MQNEAAALHIGLRRKIATNKIEIGKVEWSGNCKRVGVVGVDVGVGVSKVESKRCRVVVSKLIAIVIRSRLLLRVLATQADSQRRRKGTLLDSVPVESSEEQMRLERLVAEVQSRL